MSSDHYLSVVYGIEALFVLFLVVLSILVRTKYKYFWIGMHMSWRQPFLAGLVGLMHPTSGLKS